MSEILGEEASYQGAPSFAFKIDGYTVSRDGLVACPDTATHEEIDRLVDALKEKGFTPENAPEDNTPESVSDDKAPETIPDSAGESDDNSFSVAVPRADFSEDDFGRFQKIIASKATLLKKTLKRTRWR